MTPDHARPRRRVDDAVAAVKLTLEDAEVERMEAPYRPTRCSDAPERNPVGHERSGGVLRL